MNTHKNIWPLALLAHLLNVSLSGFYDRLVRLPGQRDITRRQALLHVKAAARETGGHYGHLRTYHYLKRRGIELSAYLVRRIRQEEGLQCKVKKRRCTTTERGHRLPIYENILDRHFERSGINQVWCCDITYIDTAQGRLYLAGVKDLYSKEIVGYSIDEHMSAELCTTALRMAIERKQPSQGLIVHSDQGSRHCSYAHRTLINEHGFIGSMSRKGECHDNAPIESFWSRLKDGQVPKKRYRSKATAKKEITRYIEITYNRQRIQAGLDYCTPAEVANQACMKHVA